MNSRVILTTCVISGLFGLYVIYALVMNTLIGVQMLETAKPVELPAPEPPPDSQRMAEQYLASNNPDAWELRSLYRVRSGDAYLYFNDWVHRPYSSTSNDPENAVEFNPFAMILKGETESDRPVTMQSDFALIKFAKAFSFSEPDTGRPVDGALVGPVRITGPKGLVIDGRDFYFSEDAQWVWSDEMVRFRYLNHSGTADGIQLDLTIDPEKIAKEQFAVADVTKITLRRNVELHLAPDQMENVDELTVTCQGGLVFETSLNIATFHEAVHVSMRRESSQQGQKQLDSLDCDKLKLQFASETPDSAEFVNAAGNEEREPELSMLQGGLTLTDIEATAASVLQPVRFLSQKDGLEATMTRFAYDCISRVATLTDSNNQVRVTQRQAQIVSPQIILQQDEQGEMQSVLCEQPGQMRYIDEETGEVSLLARWQRRMRVRPENNSGLYLIELDRQASVQRPLEEMELIADQIKLWVSGVDPSSSGTASSTQDESLMGKGRPENLLALENVHLRHPMVNGHTDRLEVWFQDMPAILQPVRNDASGDRQTGRAPDGAGSAVAFTTPEIRAAYKQTKKADQSLFAGLNNTDGENEPFDVWADLIQVLVYRAENLQESYVGGIVTTGDVTITQPKTDGSQPLRMRGNRIEVRNRDATNRNQLVHVFGSPARITDAEVSLAGNLLNLDRSENRAWVTGPGVMMRPIDRSLDGKELEQPELLKVWWKEKMEFDGRTAHFFDRVRTELGTSSVLCQEMKVTLSRRVDFQDDPQSDGEKTEIDRLECLYGVHVDSEEYKDGKLVEIRQGEFGELVYERSRDKSTIVGPGRLYRWQQGKGSRVGLSSRNEAIANQPLRAEGSEWEFLQIDFNGNIDGQIDQQITRFLEGVEIVYGPVSQVGQKLSPHNLPNRAGWISSEELEVARHEGTETERPWLELRASGNVKLEGYDNERFKARADTVTFNQSKQMYRLRALGDRTTTIWRQKTPGGKIESADAKAMLFIPSKHVLKLDETTSLEGIID